MYLPTQLERTNFVRDGKCSERRWACSAPLPTPPPPYPNQTGLIFPSWWKVRQKEAIATLCTLWFQLPGWNRVHNKCWRVLAHPFRQFRRHWPHLHRIHRYSTDLEGCEFFGFSFSVRYSTLLHLPPLRFHCVGGGCWDRTQDCCDFGIDSQTLLKVPKCEIFDRSDFHDFYPIKSLWEGDFGVKIKCF